jgi:hypothetical protein
MRSLQTSALFFAFATASFAQPATDAPLTAEAIMARVAANQDSAESARTNYIYVQYARVISRKGSKVMCEEVTDSRVTPSDKASHQEILTLNGRYLHQGKYVAYSTPMAVKRDAATNVSREDSIRHPDDLDIDIVESMRSSLTKTGTKDGLASNLFPLTTSSQKDKTFILVGRDRRNGRDVFHLTFQPKDKNDTDWKGDAYIDTEAFQPVLVSTAMSRKLPFAIRTLMGTSLPGLGFTVTYAPQPDGVWFPATFGTEFKVNVLYFFHRQIVLSAENRNFEKTHVTSRIIGDVTLPDSPNQPVQPKSAVPVAVDKN